MYTEMFKHKLSEDILVNIYMNIKDHADFDVLYFINV